MKLWLFILINTAVSILAAILTHSVYKDNIVAMRFIYSVCCFVIGMFVYYFISIEQRNFIVGNKELKISVNGNRVSSIECFTPSKNKLSDIDNKIEINKYRTISIYLNGDCIYREFIHKKDYQDVSD